MIRSASFTTACALLVLLSSNTAHAQLHMTPRGYLVAGSTWLTAADSFNAVAGTTRTSNIGGGAAVTVWKDAFVDVALQRMSLDGERVFVDQGTVYHLNIPLQVTMIPFDLAAGWRWPGRISPYGGVGLSRISYTERANFAQDGDDVERSGVGSLVLIGVDLRVTRLLRVGVEVRYRHVNGPIGDAGVSALFDERSIGGVAASFRLSIGL